MTSTPERERMSLLARVALYGYGSATLLPVALMLVFLVGSLVFSGAQIAPEESPRYDAPLPFPLFVVPEWVSIGCAVIAAVLVLPLVLTTSVAYGGRLVGMLSYTGGAIIADGFFALAFPAPEGFIPSPGGEDTFLGAHVIGVGLGLVCAVVLIVRLSVTNREYLRMRRAGELPEGQW